jgi:hypothetical protein
MSKEQFGRCYICDAKTDKLCVDHCHKTGRVRKLLCMSCNVFIGMLEKDEENTVMALNYLEEHKEK